MSTAVCLLSLKELSVNYWNGVNGEQIARSIECDNSCALKVKRDRDVARRAMTAGGHLTCCASKYFSQP